jgi:hypothetical protein
MDYCVVSFSIVVPTTLWRDQHKDCKFLISILGETMLGATLWQ